MSHRTRPELTPQVPKQQYFQPSYLSSGRFASYGCQLREVLGLRPVNVLEAGIGNGIVPYVLRKAGLKVTTLDLDASLEPDIVASVTDMPLPDSSFDLVGCFEVLEHIPYQQFEKALSEIHRLCRQWAVISIPDARPCLRVPFPLVRPRQFLVELPFWPASDHKFDGEHYWEINRKGYPLKRIVNNMCAVGFHLEHTYRPWDIPCHRFFRLKKP